MRDINRFPNWYIRTRCPEYWPYSLSYFPWFFFMAWHTLKLGNRFYFPILNPAIDALGGFHRASKTHINSLFPQKYLPAQAEFTPGEDTEKCMIHVRAGLGFPCFAKPDDQVKGIGVEKIADEFSLRSYLQKATGKVILQSALPLEKEFAVFIWRMPGEKLHISGLTAKIFLRVCADGKSTIGEMLQANMRYRMAKKHIWPRWKTRWQEIPAAGEEILIQPVGNHNKGTRFEDISHRITPGMETFFDTLVPSGIHYGRFDIKAPDLPALESGKDVMIIEFNGTIADPVHALDPRHSWWAQQRIISKHQHIQLRIGRALIAAGAAAPGIWTSWKLGMDARRWGKRSAFTFDDTPE